MKPPHPHHIGTTNQALHQKEKKKKVKEEMFLEVGRVGDPILIYLECTWVGSRNTFLLHMYKNLWGVATRTQASEQAKQSKLSRTLVSSNPRSSAAAAEELSVEEKLIRNFVSVSFVGAVHTQNLIFLQAAFL